MCPKGGKIHTFAFMIKNIEGIKGYRVKSVPLSPSHAASLSLEATSVSIFFLLPEASHTYISNWKLPFYLSGVS